MVKPPDCPVSISEKESKLMNYLVIELMPGMNLDHDPLCMEAI